MAKFQQRDEKRHGKCGGGDNPRTVSVRVFRARGEELLGSHSPAARRLNDKYGSPGDRAIGIRTALHGPPRGSLPELAQSMNRSATSALSQRLVE